MLAMFFTVISVVVILAGLYRNNRIAGTLTDIPEEKAGFKKQAKQVFLKHAAVAAVFLILAVIVMVVTKGTGA